MDDGGFYDRMIEQLEQRYLDGTDPRAQSGFRGNAARWERARRVITAPMRASGTFLDIGCANGLLMESVADWAAEGGVDIEPYGLDLSSRLAGLARSRLPQWADRIRSGNVMTWDPARRFTYVRTELGYVPESRRRALLDRVLSDYLEPGGLAIVCSYGSAHDPDRRVADVAAEVTAQGLEVEGEADAADLNGVVITRVCWTRADQSRPV